MDGNSRALAVLDALIANAEAKVISAEKEHAEALDMMPNYRDQDDVAYVDERRSETGAEVYAAKAVADALSEARHELWLISLTQETAA